MLIGGCLGTFHNNGYQPGYFFSNANINNNIPVLKSAVELFYRYSGSKLDDNYCCERQYFGRNDAPTVYTGVLFHYYISLTSCYSYSQRMIASYWLSVRHFTVSLCYLLIPIMNANGANVIEVC